MDTRLARVKAVEIEMLHQSRPDEYFAARLTNNRDDSALVGRWILSMRPAEVASFRWGMVIERDEDRLQLSILDEGQKQRQALLPLSVSRKLAALRRGIDPTEPVFKTRAGIALTAHQLFDAIRQCAQRAGLPPVSPHWLHRAHAPQALDRGTNPVESQSTLRHSNISKLLAYLHVRPGQSIELALDEGNFA